MKMKFVKTTELSIFDIAGPEYKKLQISKMADSSQLPKSETSAFDWDASSEQFNGIVVSDAFSYASCVPVS